jgi:hypothetical protein
VEFAEGGFQPLTSPSLSAHLPLTPPGYASFNLIDYTYFSNASQSEIFYYFPELVINGLDFWV